MSPAAICSLGERGFVEQPRGLSWIEAERSERGIVEGVAGRQKAVCDLGCPCEPRIDDALAVDGKADGLSHAAIAQRGVLRGDGHVGEFEGVGLFDRERIVAANDAEQVGRDGVLHEVDAAGGECEEPGVVVHHGLEPKLGGLARARCHGREDDGAVALSAGETPVARADGGLGLVCTRGAEPGRRKDPHLEFVAERRFRRVGGEPEAARPEQLGGDGAEEGPVGARRGRVCHRCVGCRDVGGEHGAAVREVSIGAEFDAEPAGAFVVDAGRKVEFGLAGGCVVGGEAREEEPGEFAVVVAGGEAGVEVFGRRFERDDEALARAFSAACCQQSDEERNAKSHGPARSRRAADATAPTSLRAARCSSGVASARLLAARRAPAPSAAPSQRWVSAPQEARTASKP